MDINLQRSSEIEQFLFDVRDHFRASLETSEYENTSNLFHMTAAEATEKLLERCERLLAQCTVKTQNQYQRSGTANKGIINGIKINAAGDSADSRNAAVRTHQQLLQQQPVENASYLYMSACKKKSGSGENIDFNTSADSDKTFRCSTRIGEVRDDTTLCDGTATEEEDDSETDADGENMFHEEDPSIYDVCHVSQLDANVDDETQKSITPDLELIQTVGCPYMDLPAGHLTIQKSSKYGQLQRIEKRLFFDQSKKCYCGILNDWLLCYADGPTSSKPSLTLHLKSNGIQIEHSGEGKRREICFQITTTADPSKRFVFQANNEVDAKEWIHAIEAAIRGDHNSSMVLNRKLPTPPVMKRMTFVSSNGNAVVNDNALNDYIYEEPSPLYHVHDPAEHLIGKTLNGEKENPPELPGKNNDPLAIALTFEYDIPKSPPQPLASTPETNQIESETSGLLHLLSEANTSSTSSNNISTLNSSNTRRSSEKLDFQTKIKDVHSKLSCQLSAAGPNLKKAAKKTYSYSSTESSEAIVAPLSTPPPSVKDNKKQKKSNTPNPSPQKCNNNNNNNNNSNNKDISAEKSARNWFLNRLNKTTSSTRNSSIISSPSKCKHSEKENLLNNLEMYDNYENNSSSNPASPILENATVGVMSGSNGASTNTGTGGKSKVNLIIKEFEANSHLFSMETMAGNAVASLSSFCDSDCNNYEPIMTVSTPPSSFMKKV